MEVILEFIFSIFGEFLLQIIFEIIAEIGIASFSRSRESTKSPVLAAISYFILGAIAGGISLLIFKTQFIHDHSLQIANMFVTPFIIGVIMMQIRKKRLSSGKIVTRMDSFTYGALFAFGMSLARYVLAA